jgi:hypothetical protein
MMMFNCYCRLKNLSLKKITSFVGIVYPPVKYIPKFIVFFYHLVQKD